MIHEMTTKIQSAKSTRNQELIFVRAEIQDTCEAAFGTT
jgi:hypothetical protein